MGYRVFQLMILTLLGFLVSQASFPGRLILETPRVDDGRQGVFLTVLTEDAKVAGYYCDLFGRHGEIVGGKPFVWVAGSLHWLPLGLAERGHVTVEKGGSLYGDASFPNEPRSPVRWDPDPQLGWRKARLTRLSRSFASVVAVGQDGKVWATWQNEQSHLQGDKLVKAPFSLAIVGIDGDERLWGNRHDTDGFSTFNDVLCYKNGVPLWEIDGAELLDVNAKGVGVGSTMKGDLSSYPTLFEDGVARLVPLPKKAMGRITSINDKGDAVGFSWSKDWKDLGQRAFHLEGSKVSTMTSPEPGADYHPQQINNRGDIAGVWRLNKLSRVYLVLASDRARPGPAEGH